MIRIEQAEVGVMNISSGTKVGGLLVPTVIVLALVAISSQQTALTQNSIKMDTPAPPPPPRTPDQSMPKIGPNMAIVLGVFIATGGEVHLNS